MGEKRCVERPTKVSQRSARGQSARAKVKWQSWSGWITGAQDHDMTDRDCDSRHFCRELGAGEAKYFEVNKNVFHYHQFVGGQEKQGAHHKRQHAGMKMNASYAAPRRNVGNTRGFRVEEIS